MSIVSEIERIKSNIANAYTACEEKGATMPSVLNSANLFDCIASITGGAVATKILNYYGAAPALSLARRNLASTSIGNYALFGGGVSGGSNTSTGSTNVDTYDKDLVKGTTTNLTTGVRYLLATSNDNYALFVGGSKTGDSSTVVSTVNAYDKDLVKATDTNLSVARSFWGGENATSVGEYALIGGGGTGTSTSSLYYSNIDAYNSNLVLTTLSNDEIKCEGGATTIGDHALFAGGINANKSYLSVVDTYDKNLVKGTASDLTSPRRWLFAISNKNYAIFAGGFSSSVSALVDVYDKNLVKGTATNLVTARYGGGQTTLGEYAIIVGGAMSVSSESSDSSAAEAFNSNLTKIRLPNIPIVKRYLAGATIGDYALFGGGQKASSNSAQSTVDVYELVV